MSNEHNIDKLLKESFDNFSPDAPDVWQAVQHGVQAAQASGAASSGAAAVAKGAGLGVKLISGIAIVATSVAGYAWYRLSAESNAIVEAVPRTEIAAEPIIEPNSEVEETKPAMEVFTQQPKVEKQTTIKPQHVVVKESVKTEPTVSDFTQEENTRQQIVEQAGANNPNEQGSQETTAAGNQVPPVTKIEQPKTETKKSVGAPYNPYSEDGEIYEKPVIPGSISPNGDGLNDRFEVQIENETFFYLMILNEKGELVFESKSKSNTWDGRHYKTGMPCEAGKYLYRLKYQYKGSEKVHEKSDIIGLFF